MSAATVSVIMPTHNRRDLLERALQSVLAQTFTGLEVVVIDDGSTDATAEYLASIDDPRVRVLRQPVPAGACAARNAGIRAATGRFLVFLDDDDEFLPNRVALMVAAYEPQFAYVATGILFINSRGRARVKMPPPRITTQAMLFRIVTGNSVLVERERVLALGGFDEHLASSQDYDLWLRLNLAYGDGVTVAEPLLVMHTEHEHARITRSPRKLFGHLAFIRKHRRHMNRAQRKYKVFEVRFLKGNLRLRDIPALVPPARWPFAFRKYLVCLLRD